MQGIVINFFAVLVGAFAGTLIHSFSLRLPAHRPLGPRPVCHNCKADMAWMSLVPFLPIRCSACEEATNWHKPATEVAAVFIVALAILSHGVSLRGVAVAVFSLILLLILRIDWQHHLIYTITIFPGAILAFLFAALDSQGQLVSALLAALGAGALFALFFALAVFIYRKHALGFGDILLAFLIGAMARIELVVAAILLGMVLAALGGLFLIAIGKRTRRDYIPYGAYLCLGAIIVLLLPL